MLTMFFSICMYGIAEREKRRGWLWAGITFALSAFLQLVFRMGYWGAVLALLATYAGMTFVNIRYPLRKGPFLK